MAYKVIKRKHYFGDKFIFRIVNIGIKGVQMFGVNKNFDTEKEAEEYMKKGLYKGNFKMKQ